MSRSAITRIDGAAMTGDRSASEILAWSRTVLAPSMRAAVDSLPSSMRHVVGYHLGWWEADGTITQAPGGKAIRPALTLLSSLAVGGAADDAAPAAVAVELVHNFSLLHDDVIDRDETRRHRLTAWRVFGVGDAILAGDALLALALDVVRSGRLADRNLRSAELSRTLVDAVQALIDGQHDDLAFETRNDVALDECVAMAERKTGALFKCACIVGALAGGGEPEQVDHLAQFGSRLGLAFQVADDFLGIWGDPQATGKPARSDLRNRKKSLPIVAAVESGTAAGDELASWLGREGEITTVDLEDAAALVHDAGGREWIHSTLAELQHELDVHLGAVAPDGRGSADLGELARLVTGAVPAVHSSAATRPPITRT